ncbi:MAG TPA: hypothetical protein VFT38_23005 [Vicinamibacteria bacterium]|nr:hypothetical protein [Vicinamibacteria bacterium]
MARPFLSATRAASVAVVCGALASAVLLPREVRISAGGDWKAVSEGLRRWADRVTVVAGPRLVLHAHGLCARAADLRVLLRANPGASPVRLRAWVDGREAWTGSVPVTPQWLTFTATPAAGGLDVLLEADSAAPPARARLVVDVIALRFDPSPALYVAWIVPPMLGALVCGRLWSRGRRWTALGWSILAALLAAAAMAQALEPAAWLRFDPATRDLMRVALLGALWALALAEPPSKALTAAVITTTVVLIYAPTVGFGLLSDDFLWARPWTARELLGAFAGTEDPLGRTTGTYRPIADLTRALDHALWGVRAQGAHLTNVVLMAAAGLLAWALGLRLRLGPRAALALAVAWVSHPLSVASVAWVSQRTDTLVAIFYLATLVVFLFPGPFGRGRATAVVLLAALALASKEMAVTLPLAAWLADRVAQPSTDRERRRAVLRVLVLLVVGYVALWAGLFPEKMLRGETQRGAWYGFDVHHPGDWLRLLPLLYATIFLPAGYEHWSRTALREWPVAHLALGLVVAPLVLWAARRFGPPESGRAAVLGLVWPLVVIGPILGARPDLYRLGLLPALAFAIVLGALVIILERARVVGRDSMPFPSGAVGLLPSVAVALLAVLLVPVTIDAIHAWRPDGFFAARAIEWSRRHEDWQASLTPESRALFLAQVERQEHAQRLLEGGGSP